MIPLSLPVAPRRMGSVAGRAYQQESLANPSARTPTRPGVVGGCLYFGDARRFWDFRGLGRGNFDFEAIIRAFNDISDNGPLSVEWEDSGMNREHGAREACEFVRKVDFAPSAVAFDAAFADE